GGEAGMRHVAERLARLDADVAEVDMRGKQPGGRQCGVEHDPVGAISARRYQDGLDHRRRPPGRTRATPAGSSVRPPPADALILAKTSAAAPAPGSAAAALPAQLRPIVQPLADLALEAALGRVVERLAAERVGEIVLARERVGHVVIVVVAGAVALPLHQPGR